MTSRTGWIVGVAVAAQLLVAGCEGSGGSGIFGGLFGGSDDSSGVFELASLGGSSGGEGSSEVGSGGGNTTGDGTSESGSSVATVYNPEPASFVLFGSGLAGLALLRRRSRKRSG